MAARPACMTGVLVALIVGASGCAAEPEAETTEAADDAECRSAAERFSGELPGSPGHYVRIAETTGGRWFCLGDGTGDDIKIGLGASPDAIGTPAVTNSGSWSGPGIFYVFVLPSGLPDGLELVDIDGGDPVFARTADGDHLLLIDDTASSDGDPSQDVPRTWQLLDESGAVVVELGAIGPAAGSAPSTFEDVFTCLERADLNRDASQPYPDDLASAAWQGCRDLELAALAASGMSREEIAELIAFVDCMADSGYIQVWLQRDQIDIAAHNAASIACTR